MLIQRPASFKLSPLTSLGTVTPHDTYYTPSDLSMAVTALPPNGTVLLANGLTPVRLRQVLTLAQLRSLKAPARIGSSGLALAAPLASTPAGQYRFRARAHCTCADR
jgi:hypothetical protein